MQLKKLEIALSSSSFFQSVVCICVHEAQMVWGLIKNLKIKFYSIVQTYSDLLFNIFGFNNKTQKSKSFSFVSL